jgi:molecular chaperone DnaK
VSFHPNGGVLVGVRAKPRRVIDPENTIYSSKRLIGRTFSSREVASSRQRLPYKIIEGENEQPIIVTRAGEFAIPEISALILDHLKTVAARTVKGGPIDRAVVTVPANFTEAQRSATATAGAIAGLTVVRVLNEPSAAAIAYGHRKKLDETIAVYDFGGGTFDVSILKVKNDTYEVLGTAGDSFLGGDDIDDRLVDQMVTLFLREQKVDLRHREGGVERLRVAAEQAKIDLGSKDKAKCSVKAVAYGMGGKPLDLSYEVSRDEMNGLARPIIDKTFPVCDEALKIAGLKAQQIGSIILAGGTTRMALVRSRVAQHFGKEARHDVSPEAAVALGASLAAWSLSSVLATPGKSPTSSTMTAKSPPIPGKPMPPSKAPAPPRPGSQAPAATRPTTQMKAEKAPIPNPFDTNLDEDWTTPMAPKPSAAAGAVFPPPTPMGAAAMRPRASSLPPTESELFGPDTGQASPGDMFGTAPAAPSPAAETPLPDLFGRPESASQSPGSVKPTMQGVPVPMPMPQILDVTPHTLSLGTVNGFCEPLVPRMTQVPSEQRKLFMTSCDGQTSVRIRVCQGESRVLCENTEIGDLVLEALEPRPRGETRIEVTFRIDESGMVQVRALDQLSGRQQSASLALRGTPTTEQVDTARIRIQHLRNE